MSNTYILLSAMHFGYGYALSANSLPTTVLKTYTPLREKKLRAAQRICAARVGMIINVLFIQKLRRFGFLFHSAYHKYAEQ